MSKKELIFAVVGLAVAGALVASYFYFFKPPPPPEDAVSATEQVSETVPEIVTNPAEEIPEVNPLDRANPFKYNNPLR